MGLRYRMNMAFLSLALFLMIGFLAIGLILSISWIIMILISMGFIVLQWAVAPWIVGWIYKIKWVGLKGLEPATANFIVKVCEKNKVKVPRIGIVEDDNPNAFCYGRTRNNAFLVYTRGIDKYCNTREKRAVIAHELGHIVHNDFVIMTVISAIPILFYIIARGCFESAKRPGGGKGKGYVAIVGVIAFALYIITQFFVLLVSRYREYWADGFSARTTRDPNALSSALVKIAYGLASEGKGDKTKTHFRYENALMISDPRSGRALAFNAESLKRKGGEFTKEDIKEAMAWDLWNPWAKWLEFKSTHPLPAKRITVLDKISEDMGRKPYVGFDLIQPESYWDDFAEDIAAGYGWTSGFPVGILTFIFLRGFYGTDTPIYLLASVGVMLTIIGFFLMLYLILYRYPMDFRRSTAEYCIDDPKANPIRGVPVILEGEVIGRGVPGLFFNEDLKIDDGTALMLVDYHQVVKLADLFEGIFRTKDKIGKLVRVKGWYRRRITPYVELYSVEWEGKKKTMRTRPVFITLSTILGALGLLAQVTIPITFLISLVGIALFLGFLLLMKKKVRSDAEKRAAIGPHPYRHLKCVKDATQVYNLFEFTKPVNGDVIPEDNEDALEVKPI